MATDSAAKLTAVMRALADHETMADSIIKVFGETEVDTQEGFTTKQNKLIQDLQFECDKTLHLIRRIVAKDPPSMPTTDQPEIIITIRQCIRGEMVEVNKKIDLSSRSQARISLAEAAIDEGLSELRYFVDKQPS